MSWMISSKYKVSVIGMILSKKEETKYAQRWSLPDYRYKKNNNVDNNNKNNNNRWY